MQNCNIPENNHSSDDRSLMFMSVINDTSFEKPNNQQMSTQKTPDSARYMNRIRYEIGDNMEIKILSPAKENLLPSKPKCSPPYTLVLDLDETLIHFSDDSLDSATKDSYFNLRPYASYMLERLSSYYEIVIFTAGTQDYADTIINKIPGSEHIKFRLYRKHTIFEDDVYIKGTLHFCIEFFITLIF